MMETFLLVVLLVALIVVDVVRYFQIRRITRHVAQQDVLIKGLLESSNLIAGFIQRARKTKPRK